MEKINFENKPSTDTPINATNLNLLQDNVEDEFDKTNNNIGDLSNLNTTDKSNVINAINEIKNDIPTNTSELTNNSGFLTSISEQLSFSSLDDLRNYIISNEVPASAISLFNVSLNGAGKGIIVQKTSNLYLSFIMWSYGNDSILHRYVNGTWYTKEL